MVKRRDFLPPDYTLYTYSEGASGKYSWLHDRVIIKGRFGSVMGRIFARMSEHFSALKLSSKSFAYAAKLVVTQAYFGQVSHKWSWPWPGYFGILLQSKKKTQ